MADTPEITKNLLEMYGGGDGLMRLNFRFFLRLSGLGALPRDARIVDCGCAMGHLLLLLRAYGFSNLTGIDAAPEMVDAARRLTGIPIILADAVNLSQSLPPQSADAVIISDLLHHIPSVEQWETLLTGCRQVLAPGGLLVIREPFPMFLLNTLYRMSRFRFLHVGFLKARLQSFVEEDHLLKYFFANWPPRYHDLLAAHGFRIFTDRNWLVHRITSCRKEPNVCPSEG